jgi:folate-binding protein YgfZ
VIDQMSQFNQKNSIAAGVGLTDRSDRVRLEITGPDRAKFLHNLTTNEIKRLAVGRGCEAFVTSPQGKTIGYLIILATEDRIMARTDPGGDELILPHFRKYGLFEDVTIDDRTSSTFELHLAGPEAAELVRRAGGAVPEEVDYAHLATVLDGCPVRVVREGPTPLPGLTVIGDRSAAARVVDFLKARGESLGLFVLDPAAFEALRIEGGTPIFGQDITEKNLPQEIGRDNRTISFVKGCYLGQETVARIDALGHVNQVLKGLIFEPGSACPAAGSLLEDDGKRIGVITSAAFSSVQDRPLALGLIRTSHARAGTVVRVRPGDGTDASHATISDLPFSFAPRA